MFCPDIFLAYWNQIPDHDFDAKELNNILYQPVSHTSPQTNNDQNLQSLKSNLRTILCKNIDVWEQKTIQKLPTFNAQDLSNTILAFSRLGLVPSEEFMAGWFRARRRRHYQILKNKDTLMMTEISLHKI